MCPCNCLHDTQYASTVGPRQKLLQNIDRRDGQELNRYKLTAPSQGLITSMHAQGAVKLFLARFLLLPICLIDVLR
jgi:hypothetical protein